MAATTKKLIFREGRNVQVLLVPSLCHSAQPLHPVIEHTPFSLAPDLSLKPVHIFQSWSLMLLVIPVIISSGTELAHWVDTWLSFNTIQPRNCLFQLR